MGFMNVFLFFIITAEVHTHNKVPANRIPKAPQARKLLRENNKKERLRFLFLVSFSVSVLSVSAFPFGLDLCSGLVFCFRFRLGPLFRFSVSVPVSRYYLPSLLRLWAAVRSPCWVCLFPLFSSRLEEVWSSYKAPLLVG